jgi:hypothetical protein
MVVAQELLAIIEQQAEEIKTVLTGLKNKGV